MENVTSKTGGLSVRNAKSLIVAGCLVLGAFTQPANAALTFNFNYLSPGEGFDDPIYGVERKSALNDAANALGAYFTNYNATVTYDITSYSHEDNTLASAGSYVDVVPGTFRNSYVQQKIIDNDNSVSADADGYINWNFIHNWGLGDNVGSGQMDFKSTAMHELLHSFGFTSYVGQNGGGLEGNAPGTADTWSIFDYFLTDANGSYLIDGDGVFDGSKLAALTAGAPNSAGVFFDGEYARAANGGAPLPIYSPNPWEEGSSIAHLDDQSDVTNQSIMNAAAHGTGLDVRSLSELELAILKDIGYINVAAPAAVPLPTAAWFMLSGLFAWLGLSRRRQSV